jgi:hypothetical protein
VVRVEAEDSGPSVKLVAPDFPAFAAGLIDCTNEG